MTASSEQSALERHPSQSQPDVLPFVSVVVIGRNEAANLPSCYTSIRQMDFPQDLLEVIYVDTDSADGSPDLARSLGFTVYQEHSHFPTAALARNRGLKEVDKEIIHFVDGDMQVDPGYLREAVKWIGREEVACVFGRLQERQSSRNWIANLLDFPWKNKTPGFIEAPGAGGTFLRSALLEVGGYDAGLERGEETELGCRLRSHGYKILMIDHRMGEHDYGITTLGGLWVRYIRMGRHFGHQITSGNQKPTSKEHGTAIIFAIQGGLTLMGMVLVILNAWWWLVPAALLSLAVYVIIRYWQPALNRSIRLEYFLMEYFFKPAVWWGMLQKILNPGKGKPKPV